MYVYYIYDLLRVEGDFKPDNESRMIWKREGRQTITLWLSLVSQYTIDRINAALSLSLILLFGWVVSVFWVGFGADY